MATVRDDRSPVTISNPRGVPAWPYRAFPGVGPRWVPWWSSRARAARWVIVIVAIALLSGCARLTGHEATPTGPGVPKVLTARFEPEVVRVGEETILIITFEDTEGDVVEAYLVERIVSDFRFVSSTSVIARNIRRHFGEVVGTVREAFRWDAPTIRFYDVYVVDIKGNASNRITTRVTVR